MATSIPAGSRKGQAYADFMERFVRALARRFPNVLLRVDVVDVPGADHQPARVPVDAAELLHRLGDDRRVDDGHHLLEVLIQQRVEDDLRPILQGAQEDVPPDVGADVAEVGVGPAPPPPAGWRRG
jgi:hypothetical protein